MDKEIIKISTDFLSNRFGLNGGSKIIGAKINNKTNNFEIEYFQSPFTDDEDIYHFGSLTFNELVSMNEYQGYTFYGLFYDKSINEGRYLFGKQVDRVKR